MARYAVCCALAALFLVGDLGVAWLLRFLWPWGTFTLFEMWVVVVLFGATVTTLRTKGGA